MRYSRSVVARPRAAKTVAADNVEPVAPSIVQPFDHLRLACESHAAIGAQLLEVPAGPPDDDGSTAAEADERAVAAGTEQTTGGDS